MNLNLNSTCSNCAIGCAICSRPLSNECAVCLANYYYYNNGCLPNCPNGFYNDGFTLTCTPCHSACSTCYGASISNCKGCSKQTQATGLFPQQTPSISLVEGDRIIAKLFEKISVGFKMGYESSLALINLLLCEKLIQDVQDHRERRQPQTLQRFIFQWFLGRLGNSRLSNLFVTDFFSSVFCEKQSRFRLFIDLVGLDSFEIFQKSTRSNNRGASTLHPVKRGSIISGNNIEEKTSIIPAAPAISIFNRSPQACKLILKACYLLKYGTNNQKSVDRYAKIIAKHGWGVGSLWI